MVDRHAKLNSQKEEMREEEKKCIRNKYSDWQWRPHAFLFIHQNSFRILLWLEPFKIFDIRRWKKHFIAGHLKLESKTTISFCRFHEMNFDGFDICRIAECNLIFWTFSNSVVDPKQECQINIFMYMVRFSYKPMPW